MPTEALSLTVSPGDREKDHSFQTSDLSSEDAGEATSPSASRAHSKCRIHRGWQFSFVIFLVGCASAGIILGFGLSAAKADQTQRFEKIAGDLLSSFQRAFEDYQLGALWLHQAENRQMSHEEFRDIYEYMNQSGIVLEAIGVVQNVTHDEREALENQTRAYLQTEYPGIFPLLGYQGFYELGYDTETFQPTRERRSDQPFYFPVRLVDPQEIPVVLGSLDLDFYSLPPQRTAIDDAITSGQPAMTAPFKLETELEEIDSRGDSYVVILFHPGVKLSRFPHGPARDLSFFTVPLKALIERAYLPVRKKDQVNLFVFDSTSDKTDPPFIGGGKLNTQAEVKTRGPVSFAKDISLESVSSYKEQKQISRLSLASREWTVVVVGHDGAFKPHILFIILAAAMIFVACCCLALWLYTDVGRREKMNDIQAAARAEKAAINVANAKKAHRIERELNDYIAHEVRNPLSAAISACSFVSSAVNAKNPLADAKSREAVREDVGVITSCLHFINDLLRGMLDIHRASSKQLKLNYAPVDVLHDVFETVAAMLYQRGNSFEVKVDCPDNLVIMGDVIRLKQMVLNLGRNSVKFVNHGFVRFRASVGEEKVYLFIEDSGPGIPEAKRKSLFSKFQDSLDSLNQGTGIGLSLCKSLSELMQGELYLDETYDSGVEGFPGTRFVIALNTKPLSQDAITGMAENASPSSGSKQAHGHGIADSDVPQLPDNLAILFVDDDLVLRKLFSRAVRNLLPGWCIDEAANGEKALQLVVAKEYDVIFMDMYMASSDKQLLGTETARALRSAGVKSLICGLSANDLEIAFLDAGADAFIMKPFPVEKDALTRELYRVLTSRSTTSVPFPSEAIQDVTVSVTESNSEEVDLCENV